MIEDAHRILNQAFNDHDISHAFILTSGGNDSVVPLHLFKDDPRITGAVHIDTGIRVPETEDHVKATCELFGLPLKIYRAMENTKADGTPDPKCYEDIVKKYGFPGPSQHLIMYTNLKERQVERLMREHRDGNRRVALITGVRKSESRRRMGNVEEIQRRGRQLWVAPITNWDDMAMDIYRTHHNLPISPVSKNLGMSGECLCGAYAKPGELDRLREFYPKTAAYIESIEESSNCPWGWEGKPTKAQAKMMRDMSDPGNMPLCTSCISKGKAL